MSKRYEWKTSDHDLMNAFRDGWNAACRLHLYDEPRGFHIAWPDSETFQRMSESERAADPFAKTLSSGDTNHD